MLVGTVLILYSVALLLPVVAVVVDIRRRQNRVVLAAVEMGSPVVLHIQMARLETRRLLTHLKVITVEIRLQRLVVEAAALRRLVVQERLTQVVMVVLELRQQFLAHR
jgi:hypothetical protein